MDTRKSAIFAFQFVKLILQTITSLIQYTILEIRFWSLKCTTVTVRRKLEHFFSFPSGMQAIAMVYEIKALQNAFKRIWHYIYLFKLYIDCSIAEK